MVTRAIVQKEAKDGTRTQALIKLLEKMNEYDQGKIERSAFEAARDAIECKECGKQMAAKTETGLCEPCRIKKEKEKRAEKAKKEEETKWIKLHHDLFQLDKRYKLLYPKDDTYDKSLRIEISKGEDHCTIYREAIYGSGYFARTKGHALRIHTNDYKIRADRLQRDFDSKDVAKHLHNKCNELFKKIQNERDHKLARAQKENTLATKIKKAFPDATEIQKVRSYPRRGTSYLTGEISFKTNGWTMKTYDGEEFTVTLTRKFNPKDMKEFIKTVKTFDSKKMK